MRSARRLDHKRTIRRNQKFQAVLGCMLGAAASVSGQSMLMSQGSVDGFFSNGLVGGIMTLALLLLFWPLFSRLLALTGRSK